MLAKRDTKGEHDARENKMQLKPKRTEAERNLKTEGEITDKFTGGAAA